MKTSTFAAKVWRWCSILLVLGAMFWTYAVNSETVAIDFDASGEGSYFLSKETIFYITMAIFLLTNVVIVAIRKQIPKIPVSMMPIPRRNEWAENRAELNEFLESWLFAAVGTINVLVGLSLLAISTVNSTQFEWGASDFAWVGYLALALFAVVFIAIPMKLFSPPAPEESL